MTIERITDQYRELPLPIKATMWFAIFQFLQKGISLLTSPFVARILSIKEYGRVSTFSSWENIFLIIVTLSSAHAVMNLCVRFKKRERMLSSLIGYNLLLAMIWGILLLLTIDKVSKVTGLSYVLVICVFFHSTFMSIIYCWINVKQYEYSYKKVSFETLIYTAGASFGSLFAIAFISKTAEAKIIPQVLSAVIIGAFITFCSFKSGKAFYDKEVWKFTFCFCVPLLPHYLSEILLMSSDRIMIDKMCGSSDVAIYSVAYTVGSLITMVTGAINSAFTPYQYHKITSKEYTILAQNTNYIIAFVAVCLCGIMLFGREIVLIFGGQKYFASIELITPISLGVFFHYVFQLFAHVQEYFEQKYTIVIASISCAVLNVVLNYVFIGLYGYKAASYTTFFCYFVFCLLHYVFYRIACKKYIRQKIYDMKGLALISVTLILASGIIRLISELYVLKYSIIVVIFVGVIWKRNRIIHFIKMLEEK